MNTSKLVVLCVIVSFVATAYAFTSSWGNFPPSSRLLYGGNIFNSSRPRQYVYRDFAYPQNGRGSPFGSTITGIRAIDLVNNGTGGHAIIYSGGPGYRYVRIKLQSQFNYGLIIRIEIYGR